MINTPTEQWTVADSALLRFLENAKPTCEKRRSTEAEDAGHPTIDSKYWRPITSKLENCSRCANHQLLQSRSVFYLVCGSAKYSVSYSFYLP